MTLASPGVPPTRSVGSCSVCVNRKIMTPAVSTPHWWIGRPSSTSTVRWVWTRPGLTMRLTRAVTCAVVHLQEGLPPKRCGGNSRNKRKGWMSHVNGSTQHER